MKTKTVMMPRELTAENGAKAAMLNEFRIDVPMECRCLSDDDSDCEICGGSGQYMQPINVPWVMIKQIYAAAVKHLGC